MNMSKEVPSFDVVFDDLNQFILHLVNEYNTGELTSWDDLAKQVNAYFTIEKMNEMEALLPGWIEMASYSDGVTLIHVMSALLGLFMMPDFHALTPKQQTIAKWMVLLHDIGKITIKGRGDYFHAFRSAIITAKILYKLGFPVMEKFDTTFDNWIKFVNSAKFESTKRPGDYVPDNTKVGEIYEGIDGLYGKGSPAALIVKGVLLHQSINAVKEWPQTAPLNEEQIHSFIDRDLFPLLRVMHLSDCEGWSMFYPGTRVIQRNETLEAFRKVEKIIPS